MKMNKIELIESYLDEEVGNPKCFLNYNKDYELLIAIVLSAQTTDDRVNAVTKILFNKYKSLEELKDANIKDLESIIKPIGTYHKKSIFIKEISTELVDKYKGIVPSSRSKLEQLPGVGRKTVNVYLCEIYKIPQFPVDTHINRIAKRWGLAKENDDVVKVEEKLKRKSKRDNWIKLHHQIILFGRIRCRAINPKCDDCKLKDICKYYSK